MRACSSKHLRRYYSLDLCRPRVEATPGWNSRTLSALFAPSFQTALEPYRTRGRQKAQMPRELTAQIQVHQASASSSRFGSGRSGRRQQNRKTCTSYPSRMDLRRSVHLACDPESPKSLRPLLRSDPVPLIVGHNAVHSRFNSGVFQSLRPVQTLIAPLITAADHVVTSPRRLDDPEESTFPELPDKLGAAGCARISCRPCWSPLTICNRKR